jgi:hypothetical protein
MRSGQIEKIEKRLEKVKSDNFIQNTTRTFGALGLTLQEHIKMTSDNYLSKQTMPRKVIQTMSTGKTFDEN